MTKPLLIRDDGTIGPAGLRLIEQMAADRKTQRTISAALNLPLKKFERLMETSKGDNEVRAAWERGFARHEQDVADKIYGAAFGEVAEVEVIDDDGNVVLEPDPNDPKLMVPKKVRVRVPQSKAATIASFFYAKTQLGWNEKPQGALVQDNRIQITLRAPVATEGELMLALGQKELMDFTKKRPVMRTVEEVVRPKPAGLLPATKPVEE